MIALLLGQLLDLNTGEVVAACSTLAAAMLAVVGWLKAVRPRVRAAGRLIRRLSVFVDVFVGRDEQIDEATGIKLPAIAPLHLRLSGIEQTQSDQAATLRALAEHTNTQAELARTQTELVRIAADHEARLITLEEVDADRARTQEESAAMWRALADRHIPDADVVGETEQE